MYSVIVPVYRNAESLPELVAALEDLSDVVQARFQIRLETVFVVDGSPDDSYRVLEEILPRAKFRSQLILHARNFGSFAAIRTGLKKATGPYFGMIAADLQEPPELLLSFISVLLNGDCDVVIAKRIARDDPYRSRFFAALFWKFYRAFVMPDIPEGGVDLFGCNEAMRDELVGLEEANSSLVGLMFWLGFRRKEVTYHRLPRKFGKSAWTFRKKLKYLVDSIFSFTDMPIRLLTFIGACGIALSIVGGMLIFFGRVLGYIETPGYAATILAIMFFGTLNLTGLGIIGGYIWRSFENTKGRPLAVVRKYETFLGQASSSKVERDG